MMDTTGKVYLAEIGVKVLMKDIVHPLYYAEIDTFVNTRITIFSNNGLRVVRVNKFLGKEKVT